MGQCFLRLGFHFSAYNREHIHRNVNVKNIRTKGEPKKEKAAQERAIRNEKIRRDYSRLIDGMTPAQAKRQLAKKYGLEADTIGRKLQEIAQKNSEN